MIPSRGRPYLVPVVLNALRYLTYPAFEVILVGEAESIDAYDLASEIKKSVHYLPCHPENISAARNIGIRAARGEIVAFIDDDSAPEPDWLDQLVAPFCDPRVGLAGGRVRDRDGVRCQFDGAFFDRGGEETPFPASQTEAQLFPPNSERQLGVMGTNCAFRRSALMAIGGFDESYRYYLDETDAALRMAAGGWWSAWAPEAEVHHLSDQNGMRGRNRQPRDTYQVGASKAYFTQRHTPGSMREDALKKFRARIWRDLDNHIRLGAITGAERDYMIARLELGIQEGQSRQPVLPLMAGGFERVILPFPERIPETRLSFAVLSGRGMANAVKTEKIARGLVTRGHRVTLLVSRTANHPLSVKFVDGLWVHEGGVLNRTGGDGYRHLAGPFGDRYGATEIGRVDRRRSFDAVVRPCAWEQMLDRTTWHRIAIDSNDLRLGFHVLGAGADDMMQKVTLLRREIIAAIVKDGPIRQSLQMTPRPVRAGHPSATVSPG